MSLGAKGSSGTEKGERLEAVSLKDNGVNLVRKYSEYR